METLPPDLVVDIIFLLPVKPILRFRCVSKSLCSLIDSRNFMKEYLQRSKENKTHRKLIVHGNSIKLEEFYATNLSEEPEANKYAEKLNHSYKGKQRTRICGFCNGLLLLQIPETFVLVLWNPFTRRCKRLPFAKTIDSHSNCVLGLGYDHVRDDYKIVMSSNHYHFVCLKQIWVFSLKLNSWTKIVTNIRLADYHYYYRTFNPGFFANDALFWLLPNQIIGFDLVKETLFKVPHPEFTPRRLSSLGQSIFSFTSLNVVEGCLFIIHSTKIISYSDNEQKESYVESHVGENGGGDFTWRKLDDPFQHQLLAYSKTGDNVWLYNGDRSEVICYDLQQNSEKKVLHLPDHQRLVVSWESLEPVGDESEFDGDVSWNIIPMS